MRQPSRSVLREWVVGPENRLAWLACGRVLSAAEGGEAERAAAHVYSPLAIHGTTGTGKSHLCRGLAAEWSRRRPGDKVVCVTARELAAQHADAVDRRRLGAWQESTRSASLFVLEDVDRLISTEVQSFLCRTLDELSASGGLVVVSSRQAPSEAKSLSAALRGRLAGGLAISLARPGAETRLALIERLAASRNLPLERSSAECLAEHVSGTVPELSVAMSTLEEWSSVAGAAIDVDMVKRYVADRHAAQVPSLRRIVRQTARCFSLTMGELRGPSRRQTVVLARGVAMVLARDLTGLSYERIGHYFKGRDHTTVLHACRTTKVRLAADAATSKLVADLHEALSAN